jgi:hypothetical protein
MSWLWRTSRRTGAATVRLVVDDEGVQRDLADGRHEEVTWAELQEVRITVLPRGPWPDRLRLILDGGGLRGCIVPRDVADEHGLVAALGRLPGLDVRRLAEALERERVGTTVLWTRPVT